MDHNSNTSPNNKSPRRGGKKFVFEPPPEAPVFRPTAEEFKDPLEYIKKIRPIGEKTGICKIIPPLNWRNPFALDMDTLKFVPRIQRINELEARTRIKLNFNDKLTKFFALSGKTFQVPVMEKMSLDLYTLHRKVKECGGVDVVNKEKQWSDIAVSMGLVCKTAPTTLKSHYDNLIHPFLISQAKSNEDSKDDNKENMTKDESDMVVDGETGEVFKGALMKTGKGAAMRELKSLRFLGPGPKMAVCDGGVLQKGLRTRGKKIMYEFDPLAKYMCKGCKKGDIEESFLVMCVTCEDRYHHSCLIPPLSLDIPPINWRCPKCVAAEGYKPLEEFGFAQAEREYTLNEFKAMANEFKKNYFNWDPDQVEHSTVEQEFWRVVSSIDEAVTVEYGADLHVIEHGSGFPRLNQPCVAGVDPKKFEKYANSPWNLNNLPVLEDSVLRHISADISGMKIPWMYAGMCFATFCWHNEDHWSYSINYLHLGDAKTWYGVPGSYAEQFEAAMQKAAPELFESQPDLLHQLVTIMNPNDIMAAGVPVYRTDQKRGEFVITFPRAYHAGFNQGFNFAEACNFAPADWLVIGRECISHYSLLGRTCVFSHDELVCKMAIIFDTLERDVGLVLVKDLGLMVEAERLRRTLALNLGVGNAVHVDFEKLPDDERQCCICNTTVFLSAVTCPCDYNRLVCLDHITKLCSCNPSRYVMKYQIKLDMLQNLLTVITNKLCGFDNWTKRVEEALNCKHDKKVSLRKLTELLVEAKEKEFPHSELVELLEYHVRRCIECSALSKALVANCSKNDNPSKITVEDLELFYQEIEKLPCSISEEAAVKDILDKSRKFQKLAQRVLSMKDVHKTRVLSCCKIGQSLNLDLPEMDELEKKIMEFDWVEKVEFALDAEADLDFAKKLAEDGKALCDSPIVEKTRRDLDKYIVDMNPGIAIVNVQSIANMDELMKGPPPQLRDQTSDVERTLLKVLHGDTVLYLHQLEKLVVRATATTTAPSILEQVSHHVTVARNWAMAADALFLKKNGSLTLMDALWPRQFVSRYTYFSKQVAKTSGRLESLISREKPDHFENKKYRSALTKEYKTLSKLRLDNMRARDVDDSPRCICGNAVDKTVIVCELCLTAMHLTCFRETDFTNDSKVSTTVWVDHFRSRRLCGYCKRTQRPPIGAVRKLADTVDVLKVKIPECYALKYTVERVDKWRRSLRGIISLDVLRDRSKEIIDFFQKFHAKRYSLNPMSEDLMEDSRLTIGNFSNIPQSTALALKEELIQGNRFEITPPELDKIWIILNPLSIHSEIESGIFNTLCFPLRNKSSCSPPNIPLVRVATMTKPMKRKAPLVFVNNKTESSAAGKTGSKKKKPISPKKKPRKQTFPNFLPFNKTTEEHEPEASCAAATCVRPGDLSVCWVECDVCHQWFHMRCVGLDNNIESPKYEYEYVCTNCVCNRVFDQVTGSLGTNSKKSK